MRNIQNLPYHLLATSILLITLSFTEQPSPGTGNLTIIVQHLRNSKGQIGLSLYQSSDGFPNHPEKALATVFIKAHADSVEYTFSNIKPGTYAAAAFHDENGDKKVNATLLGIPKEGIGVSNNVKGRFGPPKFDDAKFYFSHATQTVTIFLTYL